MATLSANSMPGRRMSSELVLAFMSLVAVLVGLATPRLLERARDEATLAAAPATVTVAELLAVWARRTRRPIRVDASVAALRIDLTVLDVPLDWTLTESILDFHDVVLEDDPGAGAGALVAHGRSSSPSGRGPASSAQGAPPRFATAVVRLPGGAGNEVFGALRGVMMRDPSNEGNVLYVRGRELLVIVDLPARAAHFERMARLRDRQGPG